MDKATSLLDMVDAQILGFVSHKNGSSLADLYSRPLTVPQWHWKLAK